MHLFSNGPCLQTLLQSTTVIQTPETAQHGSSRALPTHRRQSSDDDHHYLIRPDLSTASCSVSVPDRRQADHDGLGHWTSACRTTLADTGALVMDPERAADVESYSGLLRHLEVSHELYLCHLSAFQTALGLQVHRGLSCLDETLKQPSDWNLGTSLPSLEKNSPLSHACTFARRHSSGPSSSTETFHGSYPMAPINYGKVRHKDLAPHPARQHGNQDKKTFVLTCGNDRAFTRKYDRSRYSSPVGLTASQLPMDASRDPQMATSEVAAANLTAQIVNMFVFTIIRAVAGAVLLAQDIEPQDRIHVPGLMPSNHLVRA